MEVEGYLASPLSIGSGEQEDTDADVILDASGTPFIPGSALAGVLRSYSKELGLGKEADQLFGTPEGETLGSGSDRQSRIFCYDTRLENVVLGVGESCHLSEEGALVWKSSDEKTAVVYNGKITARAVGQTVLTAYDKKQNVNLTCNVRVKKALPGLR